jgi:polyphosphate kinase 2 (PPK2 family)
MDEAGKDGTIKHVMSGVNPQGTQVFSFKQPSAEELDHGYLWRIAKSVPERGRIGIFNRSHYEDVLVVSVHDLIKHQKIPEKFTDDIWRKRFNQINNFEKYLYENGIITIKFFSHISKDEQKKRFLRRLDTPSKKSILSLMEPEK